MNLAAAVRTSRRHPGARTPQGFYGWWILTIAVVIFGWTAIGQTQGFSVLLLPLSAESGISGREVSLIFLVGAFGGAFLMPVVGRILDDRGARRILVASTSVYAAAFVVLALSPGKPVTMAALLVVRLIGSIVLWLGAAVLVAWWFDRHRGLALGILLGAGSALLSLVAFGLSVAISRLGLPPSLLGLALLTCAVVLPLLVWGVVDHPGQLGQLPDGREAHPGDDREAELEGEREEQLTGLTVREAYRTGYAWVLTLGGALVATATTGYLFHEAVIFIEQGASGADAAQSLLPQMVGNGVVILVVSALVDRYRMRWLVPVAMIQLVVTLAWGFNLSLWDSVWAFGVWFGIATGLFFGYALAALPRYFGTRHVGAIRGMFGAITMAAAAFGPLLVEALHEAHADALVIGTAVAAAGVAVGALIVRWPDASAGGRPWLSGDCQQKIIESH